MQLTRDALDALSPAKQTEQPTLPLAAAARNLQRPALLWPTAPPGICTVGWQHSLLGGEPAKVLREPTSEGMRAWVRLLAMMYDVFPFRCPNCGNRMSLIAVIRDPAEIRAIFVCLAKHGRGSPDEG